jgi:hypothetical protein
MGAAGMVGVEVVVGWSRTRGLKPRRAWWSERVPPLEGGSEGWKLKFMAARVESTAMPPAAVRAACAWAIAIAVAALPGDGNIGLSLCLSRLSLSSSSFPPSVLLVLW